MNKWKVILAEPDIGEREIKSISGVIKSKWLTMGALTGEFEKRFSKFAGTRYAIFVNSGTAALHLACRALGLGPGDEVICPALTFVATSNAVLYAGAKPAFTDVTGLDDFNISPYDIEKKISKKTKAIMVMHYAGYPCAMDEIKKIAKKYSLFVIEDSAHALGAEYKGIKCGALSDVGAFSFFPNKNMTTAEGGMVVTNDKKIADKVRLLRSHGMSKTTWDRFKGRANSYDVLDLGYNYRPSEINAALGIEQLRKIDINNKKREKLTLKYRKALKGLSGCSVPFLNNSGLSSYHIFPLLLSETINRDKLIECLRKRGVQVSIHYPPIHKFSYYKKILRKGLCLLNTEHIGKHELTLPLYPQMPEPQVDYVVDSLKRGIEYCRTNRKDY